MEDPTQNICFMFSLYGCLGLLHSHAHHIKSMTKKCNDYHNNREQSVSTPLFLSKPHADELGISIDYVDKLSIHTLNTSSTLSFPPHQPYTMFLILIKFSTASRGHMIGLRLEEEEGVYYCSANTTLKEQLKMGVKDPGLRYPKDDLLNQLRHVVTTQQDLNPQSIYILGIKDQTNPSKRVKLI